MITYAKIINEKTKEVIVGTGSDSIYYESIGMTKMDVEQAYNGAWYVQGYAPEEPEDEKKRKRRQQIINQLAELDLKVIRSLRAIQAGAGTDADREFLTSIESQAQELRAELKELETL